MSIKANPFLSDGNQSHIPAAGDNVPTGAQSPAGFGDNMAGFGDTMDPVTTRPPRRPRHTAQPLVSPPQPAGNGYPPVTGDASPFMNDPVDYSQPTGPAPAPYGLNAEPPIVQEQVIASRETGDAPLGLPLYGCNFVQGIQRFFQNYMQFSGRASRGEFWWAMLFLFICNVVLGTLASMGSIFSIIFGIASIVFGISIIIPSVSIMVRRAHDSNKSGWWVLVYFILGLVSSSLIGSSVMSIMSNMVTQQDVYTVQGSESIIASMSGGIPGQAVTMMGVAGLCSFIAFVLFLVIGLSGPKPEGARFDKAEQKDAPSL